MRQKLCRSESAREQRIELYVQATIISTISNHRYSRNGGYRGDTEHESSPTTPTMSSHQIDSRGGRSSSTTYTAVTITTTTNNNNTRSNNTVKWRLGDYEPGQALFRHYREISSAPSSQSILSGSIAPSSHTAAASLRRASARVHASSPRHEYCQCYTQ